MVGFFSLKIANFSLVVDSDEDNPTTTYVEEQKALKEDLKLALDDVAVEEDDVLTLRTKSSQDKVWLLIIFLIN